MASQDESTKQMMRILIEQQAEMIQLMRLSPRVTMSPPTPPPNPFSIHRSPQPTFCPQPLPLFHPRSPSTYYPQPPPPYTFIPQPSSQPSHPYPFISQPSQSKPPLPTHQVKPYREKRHFDYPGQPLSRILPKLIMEGLIKPLDPKPLPSFSKKFNPSHFCAFHQTHGHMTDSCMTLRHKVQDLIENGTIPLPKKGTNPSTSSLSDINSTPRTIPHPSTSSVPKAQSGEYANPTKKRKRL